MNQSIERQVCLKEARLTAEWLLTCSTKADLTDDQMMINYLRRVNMAFHQYVRILTGEAQSLLPELMRSQAPQPDEAPGDDSGIYE